MEIKSGNVVIVVKDGRVESVYSSDESILVDVIDLDTQDVEEMQDLEAELAEVQQNLTEVW